MELKLYYLGEVSGMTKEQVEEAEKFIKGFEYGIIATCNATLEGGQMQIAGKAEIVTDVELKRELWQDWMNEYSPEGPTGDGICIIRLIPQSIRAMIC